MNGNAVATINEVEEAVENRSFSTQPGNIDDRYFFGRGVEIKALHRCFDQNEHCAVRAIRQYGKTALVEKALVRYDETAIKVVIDLTSSPCIKTLGGKILNAFAVASAGDNKYTKITADTVFKGFDVIKSIFNTSLKAAGIDMKDVDAALDNLNSANDIEKFMGSFQIIESISVARGRKTIVFIDEIQEIVDLLDKDYNIFAKQLRAMARTLTNTVLVIAGSEMTIIDRLLKPGSANFLLSMKPHGVRHIIENDFISHLKGSFETHKLYGDHQKIGVACYTITGGIASNLAFIGSMLIDLTCSVESPITLEDLLSMIEPCISSQESEYVKRREIMLSLDEECVAYKSIHSGEYNTLSDSDKSSHDEVVAKLEELMFVSEIKGSYYISDPLFYLYAFNPNLTLRKREISNIKKRYIEIVKSRGEIEIPELFLESKIGIPPIN